MIKLAGRIYDGYDDPAFVAKAAAPATGYPTSDQIAGLPDRDFALLLKTAAGVKRRYPVADERLVKMSAAYFNTYGQQLPADVQSAVRHQIKEAAARFSVALDGPVAEASEPGVTRYFTSAGQPVAVSAGLDKEAAFAEACRAFIDVYDRLAPAERALGATHLSKLGTITDPRIAAYVPCDQYGPYFEDGMRQRRLLLADQPIKLAQLRDMKARCQEVSAKRAAVLFDAFDKMAGLAGRVTDAYRTCWGVIKAAAEPLADEDDFRIATLARDYRFAVQETFAEPVATAFLNDPVPYYRQADGQVKKALRTLARALCTTEAVSEIRQPYKLEAQGQHTPLKSAVRSVRSGSQRTAWSRY